MMMKMRGSQFYSNRRDGFSLIELLVVISVIAILVGIMFPVLSGAKNNALNRRALTEVEGLASAIRAYHTVHNNWPGGVTDSDMAWTNNDNQALVRLLLAPNNLAGQNFYEGIKDGESLRDPFRSNLAYRIVISPANDSVTVLSYGLNCVAGGDDIKATH
jgi:prepilin-type N-terminal cleavage/methylation domain-containing protein